MKRLTPRRNKRNHPRKGAKPELTHEQLSEAVADYLAGGGKITKIESTERNLQDFFGASSGLEDVDRFLIGSAG